MDHSTKFQMELSESSYLVANCIHFAVNSIFHQYASFPQDEYRPVVKFDMRLFVCTNENVVQLMRETSNSIYDLLMEGNLRTVSFVGISDTLKTLERWDFDLPMEQSDASGNFEVQFGHWIEQMCAATVQHIPQRKCPRSFTFLLTSEDCNQTEGSGWMERHERNRYDPLIRNSRTVKLPTMSTGRHSIASYVSYYLP